MVKKRKNRGIKTTATLGPEDPLIGSRFQVVITSLIGGTANEHTMANLVNILRETRNDHDFALRQIWSCFLICREDMDEGFDEAKDVLIEKIASYWGVKVTKKQLEPKIDIEWTELEDLVLPYDTQKLPVIRKEQKKTETTPMSEPSLEAQLAAGEFDVD